MTIAQKFRFNFKSRVIKDEDGKEIGRTKKQPSINLDLPVPSQDEVIELLQSNSKEAEMIMSGVADLIYQAARTQFDDLIESFEDQDAEVSADMLDYGKLDLAYLASIPPAQRGKSATSEEEWNTFFADYLQVMVAATGKEARRIEYHIALFKKPLRAKTDKDVLNILIDQLDIYLASSTSLEDTANCAGRIRAKFAKWTAEPDAKVARDLL